MGKYQHVPILERYPLNAQGDTFHIALDLSSTDIRYEVGDCLVILPRNDKEHVEAFLQALGIKGNELVRDRENQPISFRDFLTEKAQLRKIPRKLFSQFRNGNNFDLKEFQKTCTLLDFLKNISPPLDLQDLAQCLQPLLPRFYSIASSMNAVGPQAHLTVKMNQYKIGETDFLGTCSSYLCRTAPLHQPVIAVYHHQSPHFHLPKNSHEQPIIMVGPGTGIAPFRGFMQERVAQNASSQNWLFFGEKQLESDFFYKEYWTELVHKGMLKLDYAFSRDQVEKIYVQHRLYEKKQDIWQWIQQGAYLYVCGDAARMAKEVEVTLHKIAEEEGKMTVEESKEFIKSLKQNGRYLKDVY